eukprot:263418_1
MSLSRIIVLLLFALMQPPTTVNGYNYAPMTCEYDTDYINSWDGDLDTVNSRTTYFLSGINSKHDNYREDRLFKWDWCNAYEEANAEKTPFGFTNLGLNLPMQITPYDEPWVRDCAKFGYANAAIVRAKSHHSNNREDRQWTFYCSEIQGEDIDKSYGLTDCATTGFINEYDAVMDFTCPNHGVVQGFFAVHDNDREDRRWGVKCCRIKYTNAGTGGRLLPDPEENILSLAGLAILSVCCGGVCGVMERRRRKKESSYERVIATDLDDNDEDAV